MYIVGHRYHIIHVGPRTVHMVVWYGMVLPFEGNPNYDYVSSCGQQELRTPNSFK
jgi:hypothetical protein